MRYSFRIDSNVLPKNKLGRAALHAAWPILVMFTERIFKEDRFIVEAEQAAHDLQDGNWNQEVFPVIRELGGLLARNGIPPKAV